MRPSAPVACDFGRGWDIGRPRLVADCVDLPPQPLATMNGQPAVPAIAIMAALAEN